MKTLFAAVFLTMALPSHAHVSCRVNRGQESIDVTVVDSFVSTTATLVRTHPLVRYPSKELMVKSRETSLSFIFSNTQEKFHLKLNKEFQFLDDGTSYFKAVLKYEDINTKLSCLVN